jgi:hypothetical protein
MDERRKADTKQSSVASKQTLSGNSFYSFSNHALTFTQQYLQRSKISRGKDKSIGRMDLKVRKEWRRSNTCDYPRDSRWFEEEARSHVFPY